jgi:hypothetical protein
LSPHKLDELVEDFHLISYYFGVNASFAEVVKLGCKKLALSSPYTDEEFKMMIEPTKQIAKDNGISILVERELLKTMLFPHDIAENRAVIMMAHNQSVLDEYAALKELKKESDTKGNPVELELEIAKRFGKLLSYNDANIKRLLESNS